MMAASRMTAPQQPNIHAIESDGLSQWIESHQMWLWRYLRFLGSPNDIAEDICQETLLAALHHEIQTRDQKPAIAWLRTTACNFFRKHLRRSQQQQALQRMLARDQLVTTDDLIDKGMATNYREALRECLGKISDAGRLVLEMRYQDNASREVMAQATGRSPEGIKTLLRRVKEQLRACIETRRDR